MADIHEFFSLDSMNLEPGSWDLYDEILEAALIHLKTMKGRKPIVRIEHNF